MNATESAPQMNSDMVADIRISGGTIIDPARHIFGQGDVLICGNRLVAAPAGGHISARKEIDATGHLVLPGLIDYHTHLFQGGSEIGLYPDLTFLPQGVTTAIDQGSAGTSNFEAFATGVIFRSRMRIRATLHVSPAGLTTIRHHELVEPEVYDYARAATLFERFNPLLMGLKIRMGKEIVGDGNMKPLEAALEFAEKLGCRLTVHTTNPPCIIDEIADLLRPGDTFTHMYHGTGSNIVAEDGRVRPAVRNARERGVLFDTADGRVNFAFRTARAAIADDFLPDTISTDLIRQSAFELPLFGLPMVMSKYLSLGMSLPDIVRGCTSAPAATLGLSDSVGSLKPGSYADVAIFQLKDQHVTLRDLMGDTQECSQVLVPRLTILDGSIVYRSIEF